jgi:hypothetical protein
MKRIRLKEMKVEQQMFVQYNTRVLKRSIIEYRRDGELEILLREYQRAVDEDYFAVDDSEEEDGAADAEGDDDDSVDGDVEDEGDGAFSELDDELRPRAADALPDDGNWINGNAVPDQAMDVDRVGMTRMR